MTVEEAVAELGLLFPEPEYTSEVSLNTRGRVDVTVFSNTAECANVLYVDRLDVDESMNYVRNQADEARKLSRYVNG